MAKKKNINVGTIGHIDSGKTTLTSAINKVLAPDTVKGKKTMKVEDLEIVEPSRDKLKAIEVSPERQFINSMRHGELPPESKGNVLFVFHRETGRKLVSLKEIFTNREHGFMIWAKTEEKALELFMKRTKWYKRKGRNVACPIIEDVPAEKD